MINIIQTYLRQKKPKSFSSVEHLSNFGILTCIIMSAWWWKVNCKDSLVFDYSKFYKNNSLPNHLFSFIVLNPSPWHSFSLDIPLMVPIIAKAALY